MTSDQDASPIVVDDDPRVEQLMIRVRHLERQNEVLRAKVIKLEETLMRFGLEFPPPKTQSAESPPTSSSAMFSLVPRDT